MAKSGTRTAIFLYFAVILYFLLVASFAEGRSLFGIGVEAKPECDSVYGVNSGDTCFAVTQMFNLTTEFFNSINPNLNCTSLFVGQWLCVDGFAN